MTADLTTRFGADAGRYDFLARGFPWRLYSGSETIENYLKEEVIRNGAKRAFVVCSKLTSPILSFASHAFPSKRILGCPEGKGSTSSA